MQDLFVSTFTIRNALIFVLIFWGMIIGFSMSPTHSFGAISLGVVMLFLSSVHAFKHNNCRKNGIFNRDSIIIRNVARERYDRLYPLLIKISRILKYMKNEVKADNNLFIVVKRFDEVMEFKKTILKLVLIYRNSYKYTRKSRNTNNESEFLKAKLIECEAKLCYICSVLEKIQADIILSKVRKALLEEDVKSIEDNMDAFYNTVKAVSKSINEIQ